MRFAIDAFWLVLIVLLAAWAVGTAVFALSSAEDDENPECCKPAQASAVKLALARLWLSLRKRPRA